MRHNILHIAVIISLSQFALAQGVTRTRVGILCAQFSDHATNPDARGGLGVTAPPGLDTVENKYRYGDYWRIIFQPSGHVVHPDADFPNSYSTNGRGFSQHGSLARYVHDNSYGTYEIAPYRPWSRSCGLLNTVTEDVSGDSSKAIVTWLTLNVAKGGLDLDNTSPQTIADMAMAMAVDSLAVAWDSVDVVIVLMAGRNPYGYAKDGEYMVHGASIPYAVGGERMGSNAHPVQCFAAPRVIFHEFMHAAYDMVDLHQRTPLTPPASMATGVGHYSLMGDHSKLGDYTPEMLDPWHRVKLGWLRYYMPGSHDSSRLIIAPIDTLNFHLPIVEKKVEGPDPRPFVLLIPVTSNPEDDGWNAPNTRMIIVENRRAIGWDSVIVRHEMDANAANYGESAGTGGFLVWGACRQGETIQAWVYDADGDFSTFRSTGVYGEPSDVFGTQSGSRVFSLSTTPSVFSIPVLKGEPGFLDVSRNLYLEFPAYVDSSDVNPISRLAIDRFVPMAHAYGESEDADVATTQYNAQRKFDVLDTITLASVCQGDRGFVLIGPSFENMRAAVSLNAIVSVPGEVMQNAAVLYYPGDTSGSHAGATYVWQQTVSGDYWVRTRRVGSNLYSVIGSGSNTWGPFQVQPRPVIAGRGKYASLAYAADGGIMLSRSTDHGGTWSQPVLISGALQECKQPYVGVFENAFGAMTTHVLFVGGTDSNGVYLYRSDSLSTVKISSDAHSDCENPIASILTGHMRIVYQCRDRQSNRRYVAQARYNMHSRDILGAYDLYGMRSQEHDAMNRNPFILHTDSMSTQRFLLCWVHNKGEKLMYATVEDSPRGLVIQGIESSLSSCVTSYPYLLPHEPGNPRLVVSRSGRLLRPHPLYTPDTLPSVVSLTLNDDRNRDAKQQDLHSALGLDFLSPAQVSMHVSLEPAILLNVPDTLSRIHYDYQVSEDCEGEEMPVVTKTLPFDFYDTQVGVFPVTLSFSDYDGDTLVVEARLYAATSGDYVSGSGEVRIPPMIGDTSVVLYVEAPNGQPPAEYYVRMTMSRGMFGSAAPIPASVTRYSLFSPPAQAKAPAFSSIRPHEPSQITIYPHPAHGTVHFVYPKGDAVAAAVHDLLGRRVLEVDVHSTGGVGVGAFDASGLRTGSYMLVVRTRDTVHCRVLEIVQ